MWRHPEIRTIPDIIRYWAPQTPDKVALAAGEVTQTYADLHTSSNRIATALVAAGVGPGSHVGYLGKNSIEFWQLWLGAGKAGCVLIPFNWRCTARELVELLTDAKPRVMVVDNEFGSLAQEAKDNLPQSVEPIVFESTAYGGEGFDRWVADQPESDPEVQITGQDVALLTYTSGTTGRPKGVQITHEAFDYSFLSDQIEPTITWSPDDVCLMVMPNFHLAGSWVSLPALYHNGAIAIVPTFEPEETLSAITRHRPTVTCLVPSAIQILLDHPHTSRTNFASLRTLIYAGSPIGAETMRRGLKTFQCEMRQFYGTTETYIITILRPADHDVSDPQRLGSCGAPVPLVNVRIVDSNEQEVEEGEVGHVLVHSPTMFAGYYNQPEETSAALRNGWYWTGDLGYRDPGGHYFLVDRAKDMIVTGGENVYSAEVERALMRHPQVSMVAVIGIPHTRWGEAVTAFVVPVSGTKPESEGLREHCREHIAGYKVPKAIYVEDSLPITAAGKIKKIDLRKRWSHHV